MLEMAPGTWTVLCNSRTDCPAPHDTCNDQVRSKGTLSPLDTWLCPHTHHGLLCTV